MLTRFLYRKRLRFIDLERKFQKPECFTVVFSRTGGFSGGPVPDPISNSAVKLPSADGTESQGSEE